jgi:uncharacterized cupredoxin-like copper-binding protein
MPRLPALHPRQSLSAVAAGALAVTLVFAGCGGGDDNGGGSSKKSKAQAPASKPASSGGAAVTEKATDFKFDQPAPTAKSGTVSFTIKNDGATTHALEVEGPKGESKSGNVSPGQSKTFKAKLAPGKYEFYCPVDGHKKLGMKGEVTVK